MGLSAFKTATVINYLLIDERNTEYTEIYYSGAPCSPGFPKQQPSHQWSLDLQHWN